MFHLFEADNFISKNKKNIDPAPRQCPCARIELLRGSRGSLLRRKAAAGPLKGILLEEWRFKTPSHDSVICWKCSWIFLNILHLLVLWILYNHSHKTLLTLSVKNVFVNIFLAYAFNWSRWGFIIICLLLQSYNISFQYFDVIY